LIHAFLTLIYSLLTYLLTAIPDNALQLAFSVTVALLGQLSLPSLRSR